MIEPKKSLERLVSSGAISGPYGEQISEPFMRKYKKPILTALAIGAVTALMYSPYKQMIADIKYELNSYPYGHLREAESSEKENYDSLTF